MSQAIESSVKAVQESTINLLTLVERAAQEFGPQTVQEMREDAQQTVLKLIAALVLADDKYEAGEKAFIGLLVDCSKKSGGETQFLNDYGELWKTACLELPRFFQAAVDHDLRYGTALAPGVLQELKLIGNHTCIVDGNFAPSEHKLIGNYVLFLEEYLRARQSQKPFSGSDAEGWRTI